MGPGYPGLMQNGVGVCLSGREGNDAGYESFFESLRADGVCRNHRNLTHDFRMATFHLYDGRARHRTTTPDRDDL